MKKIILSIDGMTCSACSNGLEKYLNKQDGVKNASVNLVMANASIEYDEKKLNIENLEEFVKKAGFKSLGEFKEIKIEKTNKKEKTKFIIFTILAIILMYISMGHMVGLPVIPLLNPHTNSTNYMITLLVLTICFIIYGFDIIRNGYKNLIHKTPNMDTLVGIGVLGRYIDRISKDKTKEAISKLVTITPNTAIIKRDGVEKEVTLDEIHKGDIVIARPGDKIAVDGEIILGETHIDESFITGESKPVSKEIGNKVIAGSLNYDGYIEYKAEKIGRESTVSEIVRLVVEATNTKAPIAKVADKVSGYFVPSVILISIITFIVYLILGQGIENALITFVTILVVACPCSLGLATPLAIIVSEGICATSGILIKKSEILENAQKINTVVFDKTGTLTYGKLKIAEIINYSNMKDEELLQVAGSVENKSTHPIGKAFTDYLEENKIELLDVKDFENVAGCGIIGNVVNEKIILGNSKILEKYNISNTHKKDEETLSEKGNSIIYVIKENEILGLIGVNDIVRDEAKEAIDILNLMQIETIMLTGDNKKVAEKIAKEIGIKKVISDVLPADKANTIKELKEENKFVMMCGDGINDSPALAKSDIGVSVKRRNRYCNGFIRCNTYQKQFKKYY